MTTECLWSVIIGFNTHTNLHKKIGRKIRGIKVVMFYLTFLEVVFVFTFHGETGTLETCPLFKLNFGSLKIMYNPFFYLSIR